MVDHDALHGADRAHVDLYNKREDRDQFMSKKQSLIYCTVYHSRQHEIDTFSEMTLESKQTIKIGYKSALLLSCKSKSAKMDEDDMAKFYQTL